MIYVVIILAIIIVFAYTARQKGGDKTSNSTPSQRGVEFTATTNAKTYRVENTDSTKWELVRRKSDRWKELGFGEGETFPGYGKLYDREFDVWYCDIGSKDKKAIQKFYDRNPLHYEPKNRQKTSSPNNGLIMSSEITGEGVILERLHNTKEYEALFTGLDNKNRKRWYFALTKFTPTGIETDRALETEVEIEEVEEVINVLEGWTLVRRKSDEWFKNGFGDGELFPGYGKIYERTFDVWYCEVGSKEKIKQPDFKDKAILNFYNGICGDLGNLKGKNLKFESLSKTQGYIELLSALDNIERKRWYFGLKKTEPTYIYTESA